MVFENLGSKGDEIGKGKKRSKFISSRNGDRRDGLKKVESDVSDDDGFVQDDEFKKSKAYVSDTDEFEHSYEPSRKGSLKKKDLNYSLAELGKKIGFSINGALELGSIANQDQSLSLVLPEMMLARFLRKEVDINVLHATSSSLLTKLSEVTELTTKGSRSC